MYDTTVTDKDIASHNNLNLKVQTGTLSQKHVSVDMGPDEKIIARSAVINSNYVSKVTLSCP